MFFNILRFFWFIFVTLLLCVSCALFCVVTAILLPLNYFFPSFFNIFDKLAVRWLSSVVNLMFMTQKSEVYEFGEDISSVLGEYCMALINHQTTVDVPLIAHIFNSKRSIMHKVTWLLDDMFRWFPFGWVSLMRKDIFIIQGKDTRNEQIKLLVNKLKFNFSKLQRKWLIIFPEGGFLYKRISSSKVYAMKNGYPNLDYVTLPRVGAVDVVLNTLARTDSVEEFTHSSQLDGVNTNEFIPCMNKVKYIVDVTIAYEDFPSTPSFFDLMMSSSSSRIYVYYRVYDVNKIPRTSTYETQNWLYKIYCEKNERMAKYYESGKFQHLESDISEIPQHRLMPTPKQLLIDWESLCFSIICVAILITLFFYYIPSVILTKINNSGLKYTF